MPLGRVGGGGGAEGACSAVLTLLLAAFRKERLRVVFPAPSSLRATDMDQSSEDEKMR